MDVGLHSNNIHPTKPEPTRRTHTRKHKVFESVLHGTFHALSEPIHFPSNAMFPTFPDLRKILSSARISDTFTQKCHEVKYHKANSCTLQT